MPKFCRKKLNQQHNHILILDRFSRLQRIPLITVSKLNAILISFAASLLLMGCGGTGETSAIPEAADPNVIAYPLDTCLVGGKKLGSMGEPHTFVYEGRQIKFCCEGCDDEFKSDTEKYIKIFDSAVAANSTKAKDI